MRFLISAIAFVSLVFTVPQILHADENNPSSLNCEEMDKVLKLPVRSGEKELCLTHSNDDPNCDFKVSFCDEPNGKQFLKVYGNEAELIRKESNGTPIIRITRIDYGSRIETDISRFSATYEWDGTEYIHSETGESKRKNEEALRLFKGGKTREAVKVWESALNLAIEPRGHYTINVELLNNLGFAYYKLWRQDLKDYDSLGKAKQFLRQASWVDEDRWVVYLNLGDLYRESGAHLSAIESYNQLLSMKPDYKYVDKVKEHLNVLYGKYEKENEYVSQYTKIAVSVPELRFDLYGNSMEPDIEMIKVSVRSTGEVLQRIFTDEFIEIVDRTSLETFFTFRDINMDGYKDMAFLVVRGATGNEGYSFLIFNPSDMRFVYNETFQNLVNPDTNPDKKMVTTFYHMGGSEYETEYYEVRGNNLIRVGRERFDMKEEMSK